MAADIASGFSHRRRFP